MGISIVEQTLRSQREIWRGIAEKALNQSTRELPLDAPKRILLFGLGSSHFAARLCAHTLLRDRSRSRIPVIACSSTSVGVEVMPQPGDWAFGFTHRGTSKPTAEAMDFCERSGAFTGLVAGVGAQSIPSARLLLQTSPLEKVEPHTIAVTGAICAVTTLLMGERAQKEWLDLSRESEPNLDMLRERAGEGPTTLLGEWEGEWLAREAGLKLMEMARLPVRVFGSEEFFHGPRFSSTPADRIWHLSHPRDPRASEIKAALTIPIGSDSPLSWVPAVVETQWLALAVALNRRVNPDDPNG